MVEKFAATDTDLRNDKRKLEDAIATMKTGYAKLRQNFDAQTTDRLKEVWPDTYKTVVEKIYDSVADPEKATDLLITVADNASTFGKQILATEKTIQEKKDAVHDAKRRAVESPGNSKTNEMFAKESRDIIHDLLPACLR